MTWNMSLDLPSVTIRLFIGSFGSWLIGKDYEEKLKKEGGWRKNRLVAEAEVRIRFQCVICLLIIFTESDDLNV